MTAIMLLMVSVMLRAMRGIGMLMMADEGDWYSRMIGKVGSSRSSFAVLIALEEGRGESCMTRSFIVHVTILLVPERAVNRAFFQQSGVVPDVDDLASVQHKDLIAIDQ
jgi:hypothetical protein